MKTGRPTQDLTGLSFGRLIVICKAKSKNKQAQWFCKCSCFNFAVVGSNNLRTGQCKSCGCWNRECLSK